jgi:hypothetical protein
VRSVWREVSVGIVEVVADKEEGEAEEGVEGGGRGGLLCVERKEISRVSREAQISFDNEIALAYSSRLSWMADMSSLVWWTEKEISERSQLAALSVTTGWGERSCTASEARFEVIRWWLLVVGRDTAEASGQT